MPWDGSGGFTRSNGTQTGSTTWANARDAGNNIVASQHDTHDQDLADGIAACLTKNNESKPTAAFRPNADASYDLGSASLQWRDAYFSRDIISSGVLGVQGGLSLKSDISPTQLAANTDNWAPTGLATASRIRFTTDASRNLTGLTGGVDGRILTLDNVGAFDIVLKDEDGNSDAANRFALDVDITIRPDQVCVIIYDATTSRWRALSAPISLATFLSALAAETAPAIDDLLMLFDTSAGTTDKITLENFMKVVNVLTEDTTPDLAADFVPTYDVGSSAPKKVLANNLNNWKRLAGGSVAAAATLDIVLTNYYALYKTLVLVLTNFNPATDDVELWLRTSTDGGSTFAAAAGNYDRAYVGTAAGAATTNSSTSTTEIVVAGGGAGSRAVGNAAAEAANSVVYMSDLDETTFNKKFFGFCGFTDPVPNISVGQFCGSRLATADVDAIRVMFESGNIDTGDWVLYGVRD
jgi:hypothetical protein